MRKSIVSILAIVVALIVTSTCVCSCGDCSYKGPVGMLSYLDYDGGVQQVEIVSWFRSGAGIKVTTVDGDRIYSSCFSLKLY